MSFHQAWIRAELEAIEATEVAAVKGRRLENFVRTIFSAVPGLTFDAANHKNRNGTLEIDLIFWNDQVLRGLRALDCPLIIECKSTLNPLGGRELRYFADLIRDKGQRDGILIALGGLAGDAERASAGFYHQMMALAGGVRILVLTREDLLSLTCVRDLVSLLKRALLTLTKQQVQDTEATEVRNTPVD